jgi:hypothetical protein
MRPLLLLGLLAGCAGEPASSSGPWKAGVARVKITPPGSMWMSGYGNRTKPAEGTLHDLWVKALALEDPAGRRALLLTADLVGIDRDLSGRVLRRLGLAEAAVLLACSHTHTGPMVGRNLECMFDLPPEELRKIGDYAAFLESAFVDAARKATASLSGVELSFGNGTAGFAVNRRNNPEKEVPGRIERGELQGPVDHDVPVLRVSRPDGSLLAVLFGYACHNTVLDFYQWSGDYAGFAQIELEKSHPGATALFFMGCGADQNPLPRRKVELAARYGGELKEAVDRVLAGPMEPVTGGLSLRAESLSLPYQPVDPASFQTRLTDPRVPERQRAKLLLAQGPSPAYAGYPVRVWRLGTGPLLVALGGEVVVDYSLRLKDELGKGRTWVAAYSNDVMAYIPSERVLREGGYEGGGAMVFYGLPGPWAPGIEEAIVGSVRRLAH